MRSLYDYDILVRDVFYRSEHILSYIERHPNMSPLDIEALSNTILDALVATGSINPKAESLDLSEMAIVEDLNHITYNPHPNVTSIPLSIKEAMRHKSLVITGSVPISFFYAKPAGPVSFCIYDMNTALSTLFPEFSFIDCNYDSPTRPGVRATKRPFLEVPINGELYLVDALTKRIFKSSWFKRVYNLEVIYEVKNTEFTAKQREIYAEQTQESDNYATLLIFSLPILESMPNYHKNEETNYEVEKSREFYPQAFAEVERIQQELQNNPSHFVPDLFSSLSRPK